MPAALSSLQTPRKALTQARCGCEELITAVGGVVDGRTGVVDVFAVLQAGADRLLHALHSLNMPLCDRLEHFRDFVVRERGFTALGIPLERDDCGVPFLDANLGRTWLILMRDLRDSLGEHKPRRSASSQKRGGGRKKKPAVLRLESQVAAVYQGERESREKNGMAFPDVRKQLASLSDTDLLRRINAATDRPYYPLRGPESAKFKRQVNRSPACRCAREPEWEESPEDAPEMLLPRDAAYALENGLRPRRAGQN